MRDDGDPARAERNVHFSIGDSSQKNRRKHEAEIANKRELHWRRKSESHKNENRDHPRRREQRQSFARFQVLMMIARHLDLPPSVAEHT